MKAEDEIEKLKTENSNLNKVGISSSEEVSQLQEQLHQLELDLTISQEKHRTCQKEVWCFTYSFQLFTKKHVFRINWLIVLGFITTSTAKVIW